MRKYLLFVLFISNFCFGQEYRDYNAPTLTKSTDNPNTVILRYNFTIRRDSIIKPDLFEVYFTLTEESINSYHKRKYYSYVIGIDSAYKKLIKHLLLLKIDTSGI